MCHGLRRKSKLLFFMIKMLYYLEHGMMEIGEASKKWIKYDQQTHRITKMVLHDGRT